MSDKNLFDNPQNAIWIFTVTGGSAAKVEGTFTLGSYKDQVKIQRSSKHIPSATLVDDGAGQMATPIDPIILTIVEAGVKLANIMHILTGNPSMYDSAKIISGHKADNNLVVDYEIDLKNAVCYFPFFVVIWFGTTPQDELIDKNFPFFFIQKLFVFLDEILIIE